MQKPEPEVKAFGKNCLIAAIIAIVACILCYVIWFVIIGGTALFS
jgi:hypothetical protein